MRVGFIKGDDGVLWVNLTEMKAYDDGFLDGITFAKENPNVSRDDIVKVIGTRSNYINERYHMEKEIKEYE